jgi:carbon-monoxide dehydrogenase medium subunit
MLVEARFPISRQGDRFAFAESGVRRMDLAIAGIALHIHIDDGDICTAASVVALGGGTRPTRLGSVESALIGQKRSRIDIDGAAAASRDDVDPPTDLQASSDYRRDLIVSLMRDTLVTALSEEATS